MYECNVSIVDKNANTRTVDAGIINKIAAT